MKRLGQFLTFCLAVCALGACSHMPDMGAMLPASTEAPALADASPRERVRRAIALLGDGHERGARAELSAALHDQPNLASARKLLDQIENDPASLLQGEAQTYTVRQGETMSQLAERFQGDALLFYALARFNNLEAPNQLAAGQVLRIPRRPGVRTIVNSAASGLANTPQTPAGGSAPDLRPLTSAPAVRSANTPDAMRANRLRLEGLQLLNGGQVDRAVAVLREAQALDGANEAIRRDLARATRLQASLRGGGGSQ